MSSILDALKKAERESTGGGGMGSQWPALPMDSADDGQRRRRVWLWVGTITIVCTIVFIAWWMRRPAADAPLVVANQADEPAAAETTRSVAPPAPQEVPPVPRREAKQADAVPSPAPAAHPPVNNPPPAAAPQVPASPPLPQPAAEPEEVPAAKPQPQPATPPPRRTAQTAQAPEPTEESLSEMKKVFRSDARIDLQALVWAPEAADRFVVINNALLKEGGSIDSIKVVRINPDDVLLSEGADRWYQEFKIR